MIPGSLLNMYLIFRGTEITRILFKSKLILKFEVKKLDFCSSTKLNTGFKMES